MPAVFGDVCEVATGSATNYRTGESQKVPTCSILMAGCSCKDISRLNNSPAAITDVSRGSGLTLQAALLYIEQQRPRPRVVVFENVTTMFSPRAEDDHEPPVVFLTRRMNRLGFSAPAAWKHKYEPTPNSLTH